MIVKFQKGQSLNVERGETFFLEMRITPNVTIFSTCFTNMIEFTHKYSWGKINTLGTNTWGSAQVLLQQIIFFCNLSFAVHYLAQ